MSEAEAAVTPQQAYLQKNAARLEAEYADDDAGTAANAATVEEPDTDDGIPDESMESEAGDDGALAAVDTDDEESDTDGIPDDDDSDMGGFEQRYKDAQAAFTEKSQELSQLKSEYSESMGEITRAKFDLQDKFQEVEQVAGFWSNVAQGDLQGLQQVNVQQLNQEQYAMWQQQINAAGMKANQLNNALAQTQKRSNDAREQAISRDAQVSRAKLDKVIDNFDDVYPDIGKFAVSSGVDQRVFKDITDPGLIEILYKAMQSSSEPDVIEQVVTKTKAKKLRAKNVRVRDEKGRWKQNDKTFREARTVSGRRDAYLSREQERYNREYSR